MLLDKQNTFSDQQTIAAAAGTIVSTNTIDLGAAGSSELLGTVRNDVGSGADIDVLCQITETVTSGGAATVKAELISSASADLSSPTVLGSSGTIALATLAAGYQFRIPAKLPAGIAQRYLGMQYVIATATTTAGKITSGIVMDRQTNYAL